MRPERMGLEEAECEVGVHNCHRGKCQSLLAEHMMQRFTLSIIGVLLVAVQGLWNDLKVLVTVAKKLSLIYKLSQHKVSEGSMKINKKKKQHTQGRLQDFFFKGRKPICCRSYHFHWLISRQWLIQLPITTAPVLLRF